MSGVTTRMALVRLYHSRCNVRDSDYESDRGIRVMVISVVWLVVGWHMWSNWKRQVFSGKKFVLSRSCLFREDPARWCQYRPRSAEPTSF